MGRRNQSSGRHQNRPSPQEPRIPDADLQRIITSADMQSTQLLVQRAQEYGEFLKENGLKSSQIRNVFAQVRQIEMNWTLEDDEEHYAVQSLRELILLKPKMAYQGERIREVKPLAKLLSQCIDLVQNDRANFQRFVEFFEAILAYHKALGGKD